MPYAKRPARRSLSRRVFQTIFITSMVLIVGITIVGALFVQQRLAASTRSELSNEAHMIAQILNTSSDDIALLESLEHEETRITLIGGDGTVLFDSESDASELPNHGDRPEVEEAMETGEGASERSSSTLGELMLYHAVRLSDGMIVRLAQEQAGVGSIFLILLMPLLLIGMVFAFVAYVTARRESNAIIAPLQEVDLDHPVRNIEGAYAEMEPMLNRLESQRQELKRQMAAVQDSDRMRREFTANITHELKTPLTTVSGYAELIANGMVTDETDLHTFGGRIYSEAQRLTSLVNDILTLSNLDETEHSGAGDSNSILGVPEIVDLPQLVESVRTRLEGVAKESDVWISSEMAPARVYGVPRLIDEILYNLASNAIRYNKPAGLVVLGCGKNDEGEPYLCVADTGIGIPEEEQQKIFERFYRVDKSRSKARGGTGLGLAIVKHVAALHNARVDLKSTLGQGTTITVTFEPVEEI